MCSVVLCLLELTGLPIERHLLQFWLGFLIMFNISYSVWLYMHRKGFTGTCFHPTIYVSCEPGSELIFQRVRGWHTWNYFHKVKKQTNHKTTNILIASVSLDAGHFGLAFSPLCPHLCLFSLWLAVCEEEPSVWEESSSFGCLFVVRNKTSPVLMLFFLIFEIWKRHMFHNRCLPRFSG